MVRLHPSGGLGRRGKQGELHQNCCDDDSLLHARALRVWPHPVAMIRMRRTVGLGATSSNEESAFVGTAVRQLDWHAEHPGKQTHITRSSSAAAPKFCTTRRAAWTVSPEPGNFDKNLADDSHVVCQVAIFESQGSRTPLLLPLVPLVRHSRERGFRVWSMCKTKQTATASFAVCERRDLLYLVCWVARPRGDEQRGGGNMRRGALGPGGWLGLWVNECMGEWMRGGEIVSATFIVFIHISRRNIERRA